MKHHSRGYVVLLALIFFGIFTAMTTASVDLLTTSERAERVRVASEQALALAEAGIDKAAYELNQDSSYTGETDTALSPGTFTITVSNIDDSTKQIIATGSVPNSSSPIVSKTVRATMEEGDSWAFVPGTYSISP